MCGIFHELLLDIEPKLKAQITTPVNALPGPQVQAQVSGVYAVES
jgi:hypothetical protein